MTVTTTYQRDVLKLTTPVLTLGGPAALPDAIGLPNGGYALAYIVESGGSTFAQTAFHNADPFLFNQAMPQYASDWTKPSSIMSSAPITRLANGNFLVVWDNDESGEGLTGRLFTPAGVAIGNPFILIGDAFPPSDVQVAALANSGFAISYTRFGNVWCARYDNAGTFLGTTLVN